MEADRQVHGTCCFTTQVKSFLLVCQKLDWKNDISIVYGSSFKRGIVASPGNCKFAGFIRGVEINMIKKGIFDF